MLDLIYIGIFLVGYLFMLFWMFDKYTKNERIKIENQKEIIRELKELHNNFSPPERRHRR